MRDRYHTDHETGVTTAVSDLPSPLLHKLLSGQFVVDDECDTTRECILERLRIELTARRLEGRL